MYKVLVFNRWNERTAEHSFDSLVDAKNYATSTPNYRHEIYNVPEARWIADVYGRGR